MKDISTSRPQRAGVRGLLVGYRRFYRRAQLEGRGSTVHPGDLLYWVGCVGAISALLFVTMR